MYTYRTKGVCSSAIHFNIDQGKLHDVSFDGGCNGNLKAIGKLVEGRSVDEVIATLEGNTCGPRPTSCADQLACALRAAQAGEL